MTRARSVLSVVLLSAAATLGGVGTAQAALYTGKWDPAYGTIFPELGWEASAVFDVPDACLLNNGSFLASACPGFTVVSAQVGGNGFNGPSHFAFRVSGDRVSRMTIRA